MLYLFKDRLLFIMIFSLIILVGIVFIISLFKIKQSNKILKSFLCLFALITLSFGLYGLFFVIFFGFNS